jgi:hypothetical protein
MWKNTTDSRWGKAMRRRDLKPELIMIVVASLLLLLALILGGCAELSYKAGELYGWNCRPEALQNGRCVPAR